MAQKSELLIRTDQPRSLPRILKDVNEVLSDPDDISFVRGTLRCLGHSAAGTTEGLTDEHFPPVNPWKLAKSLTHAAISKTKRRELMECIKEDMSPGDLMGLLGLVTLYGYGREAGLSREEARTQAYLNAFAKIPIEKSDVKRK